MMAYLFGFTDGQVEAASVSCNLEPDYFASRQFLKPAHKISGFDDSLSIDLEDDIAWPEPGAGSWATRFDFLEQHPALEA